MPPGPLIAATLNCCAPVAHFPSVVLKAIAFGVDASVYGPSGKSASHVKALAPPAQKQQHVPAKRCRGGAASVLHCAHARTEFGQHISCVLYYALGRRTHINHMRQELRTSHHHPRGSHVEHATTLGACGPCALVIWGDRQRGYHHCWTRCIWRYGEQVWRKA